MFNNFINGINLVINEPYPSINGLKENLSLAYKIKKSYSSKHSEFSCISKYLFQELALDENLKEIKHALNAIAMVEMKHFQILGEILVKLGLSPTFTYINKLDNETYWQSDLVDYNLDLMELLKNNIKDEEIAIKNYKDIIKYANDEIIADIINRIILDEEHHIKIFKSILKNLV